MQSVYTHFRARRFRLFDDVAVEFSPFTIVSGRNNAGKTALLEALFLHATGPRAGAVALSTLVPARSALPINLPLTEGPSVWDSLFRNSDTQYPIELSASFNGSRSQLTLSVTPATGSAMILQAGAGEARSQSLHIEMKMNGATREYVQTVSQQQLPAPQASGLFNIQVGTISGRLDPPGGPFAAAHIITSRTRSNQAEIAQRYSDLRVLGRQLDLFDAIRQVDNRLEGIEVLVKDGQPLLHLSMAGYDKPLPLSLFGEGMVAAVDILSLIYAKKSRVVLIDEIENGIHYSVLPNIWWHIKRAAKATDTQIIATTHSRECIEAAQKTFAKDGSDALRLLRLWRRSPQSDVTVTPYDFAEIGNALDQGLDVR